MSIYVDDMRRPARPTGYRGRGTPNWSHMMADTHAELMEFAQTLKLNPAWLQHAGKPTEHFDVTDTVRSAALKLGAVSIRYGRAGGLLTMFKSAERGGQVDKAKELKQRFLAEIGGQNDSVSPL